MGRIRKCRDCGGKVSSSAQMCPHCGATTRGRAVTVATRKEAFQESVGKGCVLVFVMLVVGLLIFKGC